jgi:hypothetical protein
MRIVLPSKFTRVITITIRIWKVPFSNLAGVADYLEVLHPLLLLEAISIRVSLPCLLSLTGCVCMRHTFKCLHNLYLFTFKIYLFKSCVCNIFNFNSNLKFSFLVSSLVNNWERSTAAASFAWRRPALWSGTEQNWTSSLQRSVFTTTDSATAIFVLWELEVHSLV